MPLTSERAYQRQERVVTRQIVGETLLVPISDDAADMSHLFALNSVAAHIWEALDGSAPLADIVSLVERTFDVDRDQAEQDTFAFVDELLAANLVTRVEEA